MTFEPRLSHIKCPKGAKLILDSSIWLPHLPLFRQQNAWNLFEIFSVFSLITLHAAAQCTVPAWSECVSCLQPQRTQLALKETYWGPFYSHVHISFCGVCPFLNQCYSFDENKKMKRLDRSTVICDVTEPKNQMVQTTYVGRNPNRFFLNRMSPLKPLNFDCFHFCALVMSLLLYVGAAPLRRFHLLHNKPKTDSFWCWVALVFLVFSLEKKDSGVFFTSTWTHAAIYLNKNSLLFFSFYLLFSNLYYLKKSCRWNPNIWNITTNVFFSH